MNTCLDESPSINRLSEVSLSFGERARRAPVGFRIVSGSRLAAIALAALYVGAFFLSYRELVAPVYAFWGLSYRVIPAEYLGMTVALCIFPSFWMPLRFSRPSMLLFYLQYLLVFVPAAFVAFYSSKPQLPLEEASHLVWMMFAGLSIIQAAYVIPSRPIRLIRLTPGSFWLTFGGIAVIMFAYIVIVLSSNFRLANFKDIYTVRYAMAELVASTGSRFGLYAQYLLLSVFLPIAFSIGALSRRWWIVAAVGGMYVFLFGILGAKSAVLALAYLPLVLALLTRRADRIVPSMLMGLTMVLLLGFVSRLVLDAKINLAFLSVVHFRLFTVPAETVPQYAYFFRTHPVTHWSNVTGFNWLLVNPYDLDIPYMIGRYFYHAEIGANSGMWASDGLGGFGAWGIPLVSAVCAFTFWMLDSLTGRLDPRFVALAVAFSGVSLMNVSLFTTLVSGGLGFAILALAIAPSDSKGHVAFPRIGLRKRFLAITVTS